MANLNRVSVLLTVLVMAVFLSPQTAFAEIGGAENQITDQPDRLILQLGPEWAGVEFELRTDAGKFPVPVVVDSAGVLRMDLGGSQTYTLSCVAEDMSAPNSSESSKVPPPAPNPAAGSERTAASVLSGNGIPTAHLVMFLGGLTVAIGVLLLMLYLKRREAYYYDDDEDYDDD